jgi:hypothetical protein
MKRNIIFGVCGLLAGCIAGWALFAEPETKEKIFKDRNGIHIYSYYVGGNGKEIKEGWEYWLHSDMVTETEYKYKRGKVVLSESGTDYASWEHVVPGQGY